MIRKMPAFAISALVTLALPLTALAQNASDFSAVVSNGGSTPAKRAPTPSTFGTAQTSYIEVPANAFQPWNSSQTYTSDNGVVGPRWVTSGGDNLLLAPLHLPSGAKITSLELDFTDTSASGWTQGSLNICDYHSTNCTQHPVAGAGTTDCAPAGWLCSGLADAPGNGSIGVALTPDDLTVDNYFKSYSLLAAPVSYDGSERIGGMIVGYVLQVSPDPVSATFSDVPVGHPFHRYVEALYAAGITAGCGGGNYCPGQAITRGQMAVFLSLALGLQFP